MTLAFTEKAQTSLRRPELQKSNTAATQALLQCQQRDGHWVFELEADALGSELLIHGVERLLDAVGAQDHAVHATLDEVDDSHVATPSWPHPGRRVGT